MLEKSKRIDRIEVLETGEVQFREVVTILENGNVISTAYHRWLIVPGQDVPECANDLVKKICALVHTDDVVKHYTINKPIHVSEGE